MISVWSDTAKLPSFSPLKGDIKTDVLIIGGGIAGIMCAYMLKSSGIDCVIAEASSICSGITKNTTAKITSQHGLIYSKLINEFGAGYARMYLEANQLAVKRYRELCRDIDCDFSVKDAFVYSTDDIGKIEKELEALHRIKFPAEFESELPLPFSVAGAVKFKAQAQFNPLKFISSIAGGLNIYENTVVRSVRDRTALTGSGKISAEAIIVATHFPFINKHGWYFLKMYQSRSYVIALENAPDVNGMYIDEKDGGLSFRNYRDLLLIGGGDHRTGRKGGSFEQLAGFAAENYPSAREKYRWSTQDCMTLDGAPYIGQYSKSTPYFYVATGFNKWGMTSSMVAASILTDMICGVENPYASIFSPSRTIMRPQLAINAAESAAGLLSFSTKRCPHLGCALKWNKQEHSWDCPCHGSRFTQDGRLIDNPATCDLKRREK